MIIQIMIFIFSKDNLLFSALSDAQAKVPDRYRIQCIIRSMFLRTGNWTAEEVRAVTDDHFVASHCEAVGVYSHEICDEALGRKSQGTGRLETPVFEVAGQDTKALSREIHASLCDVSHRETRTIFIC